MFSYFTFHLLCLMAQAIFFKQKSVWKNSEINNKSLNLPLHDSSNWQTPVPENQTSLLLSNSKEEKWIMSSVPLS